MAPGFPFKRMTRYMNQLDSWVCQARPIATLRFAQRLAFKGAVEIFFLAQYLIDYSGYFQGNQIASYPFRLFSPFTSIEIFDLRVILHRSDRCVTECQLQVLVTGL